MFAKSSYKFAPIDRLRAAPQLRGAGRLALAAFVSTQAFAQALAASAAAPGPAPAWPDSFRARLEILALVETLNANLLASRSATETLTQWCAAHDMAQDPKITAHVRHGIDKPISPEQRRELDIGPDEPVVYRRVDLACGAHILSQADNWYVPARLTPAMNAALTSSDIPFGRVVRPLHPHRLTISVRILWQPLPQGWEMTPPPAAHSRQKLAIPPLLFEHRALVFAADGRPISEVDEAYRADILDFRPQP